ncbi:MAG: ABC transporter ATP-binding protein [Nitrospiraceae bacterium]|nr:ABC transporter ATP-binding protein [Nitrospiraceae bacterium]
MPQVVLKDLSKVFKIGGSEFTAVSGANLEIEKGDFISIVGHSGSGKTTLMSIIGGILRPSSGSVLFDGEDIYSLGENRISEYRAAKIGYVFQFASLMPVLTAKENLLLPTVFTPGLAQNGNREKKALEYLELVGLKDKGGNFPYQLSGGQQRRVAIARAIMNGPALLLADEPTGDLDEETEAEVMKFFELVNREMGITFVLVTHSSELAAAARRKFRMANGTLTEKKP